MYKIKMEMVKYWSWIRLKYTLFLNNTQLDVLFGPNQSLLSSICVYFNIIACNQICRCYIQKYNKPSVILTNSGCFDFHSLVFAVITTKYSYTSLTYVCKIIMSEHN